jgi:hypothetical protein
LPKKAILLGIVFGFLCVLTYNILIEKEEKRVKYILLWNEFFDKRNWGFEADTSDHKVLKEMGCKVTNCVFTSKVETMQLENFDAVLFHMIFITKMPQNRSSKQIYVGAIMESPAYHPLSFTSYNSFFNWTSIFNSFFFVSQTF